MRLLEGCAQAMRKDGSFRMVCQLKCGGEGRQIISSSFDRPPMVPTWQTGRW